MAFFSRADDLTVFGSPSKQDGMVVGSSEASAICGSVLASGEVADGVVLPFEFLSETPNEVGKVSFLQGMVLRYMLMVVGEGDKAVGLVEL